MYLILSLKIQFHFQAFYAINSNPLKLLLTRREITSVSFDYIVIAVTVCWLCPSANDYIFRVLWPVHPPLMTDNVYTKTADSIVSALFTVQVMISVLSLKHEEIMDISTTTSNWD